MIGGIHVGRSRICAGMRGGRGAISVSYTHLDVYKRQTLGTIASISPLMGLFGTVVGMIEIFGSQSPTGTNPMQLAHGISVALYNTGFGLVIAIPGMIFWRHFRALVNGFVIEMQQQALRLVEVLHNERKL